MQTLFRPKFRRQLDPAVATRKDDCGPVATRHALQRASLGALDPPVSDIRAKAKKPTGQFGIYDVVRAIRAYGLEVTAVWDRDDDYHVDELEADLGAGRGAVVVGDYDEVPLALKGDREFMGNHFIFLNESDPVIAGTTHPGTLVYDSLDDGRIDAPSTTRRAPKGPIVWPDSVRDKYLHGLSDKQDEDVTVAILRRRLLNRKATTVNVRPSPTRSSGLLGTWVKGSLEHGGIVTGESVGGNSAWYRVWWPEDAVVAFVHSSIVIEAS